MNYNNFTNLYSLSKTLRFELKPIWATWKLLDENQWDLFKKDKIIEEIYQNILKPKLEKIDNEFIENSLNNVDATLFWEDLINLYKKDKKEYTKQIKSIAKKLWAHIQNYNFHWLKWTKRILDDKKAVEIVKELFWNEIYENSQFQELNWKTIKDILDNYFKWFTTYLSAFNKNRENFYKDDLKFGSAISRILKDNLPKFIENIFKWEKILDKVDLSDEERAVFNIENFVKYLNQPWIDHYNKIIGKINSKINEYNQKHNLKWSQKLPFLTELYKQVLWESSKEDIFNFALILINSDEQLLEELKKFVEFENITYKDSLQNIINNFENFDLSGIWIKRWNLKKLSNKYLKDWSLLEKLLPSDKKWEKADDVVNLEKIKQAFENTNLSDEEIFKGNDIFLQWFEKFIILILNDFSNLNIRKQKFIHYLEQKVFNAKFEKSSDQKQAIKDYLDTVLEIYQLANNFTLKKWKEQEEIEVENKDSEFFCI